MRIEKIYPLPREDESWIFFGIEKRENLKIKFQKILLNFLDKTYRKFLVYKKAGTFSLSSGLLKRRFWRAFCYHP